MKDELERSIEEQQKFQYYFTALIFTLLAASISSANISDYGKIAYLVEVSGWGLLLLAGLCFLLFIEQRGRTLRHSVLIEDASHNISTVTRSIEEKKKMDRNRKRMFVVYNVGRLLFVVGIISVVSARVYDGYQRVFGSI